MVLARSGLTLAEFLDLPEEKPALEFEDGRLTQKASPQTEHSALQMRLGILLESTLAPRRIARAFPELQITLGNVSWVPDLSVFRWERIPRNAQGRLESRVVTPPDVAIEIPSPEQTIASQLRRCRAYVDLGVAMALMVDHLTERVWLVLPHAVELCLEGAEPIPFGAILPGFTLTPGEIFMALLVD